MSTSTLEQPAGGPPGDDETTEADLARARKEQIGRIVAIFVMPFLMVG